MDPIINETNLNDSTTIKDIEKSVTNISKADFESAGWPIISSASKQSFYCLGEEGDVTGAKMKFWEEVLNPKNFLTSRGSTFDPNKDFLFIIHSFPDDRNRDSIFKAVTTHPDEFIKDPRNMIRYDLHGRVCENRSSGSYPTCNFWDFYNNLTEEKQNNYPIPDKNWRKNFILTKVIGEYQEGR